MRHDPLSVVCWCFISGPMFLFCFTLSLSSLSQRFLDSKWIHPLIILDQRDITSELHIRFAWLWRIRNLCSISVVKPLRVLQIRIVTFVFHLTYLHDGISMLWLWVRADFLVEECGLEGGQLFKRRWMIGWMWIAFDIIKRGCVFRCLVSAYVPRSGRYFQTRRSAPLAMNYEEKRKTQHSNIQF